MSEEPDPIVGVSATAGEPQGARPQGQIPPYKILFAGDLTPGRSVDDWSEGKYVTAVDKHSFADFMAASQEGATISIDVPNRITASPSNLELTLSFGSLNDFKPNQLALKVPALARLLSVRQLLAEAGKGQVDAESFRSGLAGLGIDLEYSSRLFSALFEPENSDPEDDGQDDEPSSVDRLLSMIDMNGDDEAASKSQNPLLSKLIDAVRDGDHETGVDSDAARSLIQDVTGIVSAQVGEIVKRPEFKRLESAWLGLKLLVDRFDFRSGLQLEVLSCSRDDANEAVYRQVLMREFSDNPPSVPISLVVLDYAYSNSMEDVERLEDFATTGASMQSPVVAGLDPGFFGVDDDTELTKLPLISQHVEGPDFLHWNKLRDLKESEYLCLALPSFLLRDPYEGGRSGSGAASEDESLWGRASVAVGLAVGGSYAETGWPTSIVGRPIRDLPVRSGGGSTTPLAVMIPDEKVGELAKAGFATLTAKPNSDKIELVKANTVRKPEPSDDLVARTAARVHATLPARLFIARAAHFLVALQNSVPSGDDKSATLKVIATSLRNLMRSRGQAAPDESVSVEHVPEAKLPNDELWAVKLRAHRGILPKEVSAMMGLTTQGKYTDLEEGSPE